jgi:hypothetical protein
MIRNRAGGTLLSFLLSISLGVNGQIAFEEVRVDYNVVHTLGGKTIGAGVTIYDFNQDGLDDLTLGTHADRHIGFYINTGTGFELIDPLVDNVEIVKQINWVDYDNDGDPDLYVAANDGISRFYRNNGDLDLEDITEESGLPLNTHFGYGAAWGDYNRDGWLDLYYVSKGILGDPDAIRSYNRLFRNNANGTFTEQTEEANVADDGKLPFCAAFVDYNNDMWPDIYIANDKLTYNTLLENDGFGRYIDVSEATGANAKMNAMSVSPGDYNRDGWIDIYVTNTPIGSQYFHNTGVPNDNGYIQYIDVAADLGIHFPGGNCWGANFLDADNDGDLDLYVCSSIPVPKEVSSAFYENIEGSQFISPVVEGFAKDTTSSFSNAVGDFNNDGLLDILVQNNDPEEFYLWENRTANNNHWIKVDLEGVLSNRDGIGAKIESYSGGTYQMQFTTCGSSFLGQNSSYKHIGLGQNETLDSLIITWPTGHIDKLNNVAGDQIINVLEGSTTDGVIQIDNDVKIEEWKVITSTLAEAISSISLYPNPGEDQFIIDSESRIERIDIFSAQGLLVYSIDVENNSSLVDASDLINGAYLLKIQFKNQSVTTLKWIKQ